MKSTFGIVQILRSTGGKLIEQTKHYENNIKRYEEQFNKVFLERGVNAKKYT